MSIQQMLLGAGGVSDVVETLSGSGSWTAPAGVTSVDLVMLGTEDLPEVWMNQLMQVRFDFTPNNPPSTSSANDAINAWLSTNAGAINVNAPNQRALTGPFTATHTIDTGETVTVTEGLIFYPGHTQTYQIKGTLPSSGSYSPTISNGGGASFQYVSGLTSLAIGIAGSPSTMFGYTANGASVGGSAGSVTQTVSVTPGTSYSYVVGYKVNYVPYRTAYGSIQLTYTPS